jgi:aspartate/methionine/tyrosine aminotransferase
MPGFSIDRVAADAGDDPAVLRMENMDTDIPPPRIAVEATKAAVGRDEYNSYLPFTGSLELRQAVSDLLFKQTRHRYNPNSEIVITNGLGECILDALIGTTDPGDEVILTDPTYAGIIWRTRLAGAVPRLVPLNLEVDGRLDLEALRKAVSDRTRVILMASPVFPCCMVLTLQEWEAIAEICREKNLWLLYNAAMGRILFDNRPYVHPATLQGMKERTVTLGCATKEQRMIGWRVGWAVGPVEVLKGISQVHIYNGLTPGGISQAGACAALQAADEAEDTARAVAEWQKRRDTVVEQLRGYPIIPAEGGWCMLVNVQKMGFTAGQASQLLLEKGRIAATPMTQWGEKNSDQYVRLVFSNEPLERLKQLKERFDRAFQKE